MYYVLEAENRAVAQGTGARHPTFMIEGKMHKEWVGEAHMIGFEILSQLKERLCAQEPGRSIAS